MRKCFLAQRRNRLLCLAAIIEFAIAPHELASPITGV